MTPPQYRQIHDAIPSRSRVQRRRSILHHVAIATCLLLFAARACAQEHHHEDRTADSVAMLLHTERGVSVLRLTHKTDGREIARLRIAHPVYHVEPCDINHDGRRDVCVGLIKTTRFDPVRRRRLFFYTHDGRVLRPLWLGSRLGMPLETFRIRREGDRDRIMTLERERRAGRFAVGIWEWRRFGLAFVRYEARGITRRMAALQHGFTRT